MTGPKTVGTLQLEVTLLGCEPPVWRRFVVPEDTALAELHVVLQIVMGWEDAHLHEFSLRRRGTRVRSRAGEIRLLEEDPRTLGAILGAQDVDLIYEYDAGDSWVHRVRLEKRLPGTGTAITPVCLAGERACPPEDCGGVHGYERLLHVVSDPAHPDHQHMLEWLDGDLDPEAFDCEETSRRLAECWEADD